MVWHSPGFMFLPRRDTHRIHSGSIGQSEARSRGVVTLCAHREQETQQRESSPTDCTMGKESSGTCEHSSLGSPRMCVSGRGTRYVPEFSPWLQRPFCNLDTLCPLSGARSCREPHQFRKFHKALASAIFCPHHVSLIDDPTNSHWQPFVV